jgi:lipopolysaccharide transport system ATP-binding protein
MYVRLAFAIAAHLEPEILVIDEVLAVGDASFQQRCLGKINQISTHGRTVLFVSHNMGAVQSLCRRCVVLNQGRVSYDGAVCDAISSYLREADATRHEWVRYESDTSKFRFKRIASSLVGQQPDTILQLDCTFAGTLNSHKAMVAFDITDSLGMPLMQALPRSAPFIKPGDLCRDFRFRVKLPRLVPGKYWVTAWAGASHMITFDLCTGCVSFEITSSPTAGRTYPHTPDHGFVVPESDYETLAS